MELLNNFGGYEKDPYKIPSNPYEIINVKIWSFQIINGEEYKHWASISMKLDTRIDEAKFKLGSTKLGDTVGNTSTLEWEVSDWEWCGPLKTSL